MKMFSSVLAQKRFPFEFHSSNEMAQITNRKLAKETTKEFYIAQRFLRSHVVQVVYVKVYVARLQTLLMSEHCGDKVKSTKNANI